MYLNDQAIVTYFELFTWHYPECFQQSSNPEKSPCLLKLTCSAGRHYFQDREVGEQDEKTKLFCTKQPDHCNEH